MRSFVTLSVVLLAVSVSVSPLPVNTITLRKLNHNGIGLTTVPATNPASIWYTTSVGIGNPPPYYNLVVDAGSSITFCGTGSPYVRTPTSVPTGQAVSVNYELANFTGEEYLDQVTLAPNLVLKNQSISGVNYSYGFQSVDGILGLGPPDLTRGILTHNKNETISMVMNNLVTQGLIKDQILGVYYTPTINDTDTYGALTYGGADSSLYECELTYVPLTDTYPAAKYWGINASATYGNYTVIPNSTAGIVDTGSTLVHLADNFFSVYSKAIGASLDAKTRMLEIPASKISSMQSLNFCIGDRMFAMDAAAQLFPRDQNVLFGGDPKKYYGVVNNLRFLSNPGFGFVLGMKYVERYYAVSGPIHRNNTFATYLG